jgi:hypothetical protein
MSAVRDRVREQPLPGETEAAARSWPVVEAALATRGPARRRRHVALRLALVSALLCVGLVAALTPAGAEVGDWIGDRFAGRGERAAPAFTRLPEGGSVLAISRAGAFAAHPDGSSRRLGSFSDAGWSPHGLHVVGVDGRRLVAVTPTGTTKWTLARPRRVHHPAWSPGDGFFVAYLEGGRADAVLRTVDGKGNPATDRRLRRRAAAVTPAWRRGEDYVLSYATAGGAIETLDATTGRRLWRTRAAEPVRAIAWSRDGRRLVALSSSEVTVLSRDGRELRTLPLPGTGREMALHPSGERASVVVAGARKTRVLELPLRGGAPRQVFQGDVDGLAWSEDGRHLLLAWRDTGEWLLLGPGGRIRALNDVAKELGATGGFPRVAGWCCPG